MRFEYLRNDNCVALANISLSEVVADITDDDLVLELDSTGIKLNRFVPLAKYKEPVYIVWIDHRTEIITLQQVAYSYTQQETVIEDLEFSISGWDEVALIQYIQQ